MTNHSSAASANASRDLVEASPRPTIVRRFFGRPDPGWVPSPDLAWRDVPPTESERDRIERIVRVVGVPDSTEDEMAEMVNVLRRDSITREEHEDAIALERFLHECRLARNDLEWRRWIDTNIPYRAEKRRRINAERERDQLAALVAQLTKRLESR